MTTPDSGKADSFTNAELTPHILIQAKELAEHLKYLAYVADLPEEAASEASALLGVLRVGIATSKKEAEAVDLVKTLRTVVSTTFGQVKDAHRAA